MKVFEVSRPIAFRDYLKVLAVLRDEVNLTFKTEGLESVLMDLSHVAMIDSWLPMESFDRWNVEEDFTVGLNLEDVNKVLKKMNKSDSMLTFDYDYDVKLIENAEDQQGNQVTVNEEKINEKVTFTLRSDITRKKTLTCPESLKEEIPKPRIFFKSHTRMLLKTFKRILDDFKDSGEHITIKTNQEEIIFSIKTDIADETTPISRHNDNILEHRVEEDSKTTYTLSYLADFVRAAVKVSEVATLRFSEDMPIALDIELPQGKMIYYVAPCIGV